MMPYASRTGTRRNLDMLRERGWGLMLSAAGVHRTEGFKRYALDNGAWTAHTQGRPWDQEPFLRLLDAHGAGTDFVVAPDVVEGGSASLDMSLAWLPRLAGRFRLVLIPVQDGMTEADVEPHLSSSVGIFVGGSTDWKITSMPKWGALGRRVGCHVHVGRVNTVRRINACIAAGVDSFDGSSASRYAVNVHRLDMARRQTAWMFD